MRAILLAVVATLVTCKHKEKSWEVEPPADTLEELRALGYVDYATSAADLAKSGVTVHHPESMPPGAYLYGAVACHAKLLDIAGQVINQWQRDRCVRWRATELTPNGDLLVVGIDEGPGEPPAHQSHISRLSWSGELIWKRELTTHHDIEVQPNGEILVLTTGHRKVAAYDEPILDDKLTFVSPAGVVLREYSMYDMVVGSGFDLEHPRVRKNVRDVLHTNSVHTMTDVALVPRSPFYEPGNVLVASRRQSSVFVFDLEREKMVWAWGRGELDGPHDATVIDNGNFLIFDNGWKRGTSRVIEVDPATRKIVWQYAGEGGAEFFSKSRGSAQRLKSGHTLIGNSNSGQALEIDPSGEPLWEFNNPVTNSEGHRGAIIRMRRFDPAFTEKFGVPSPGKKVKTP